MKGWSMRPVRVARVITVATVILLALPLASLAQSGGPTAGADVQAALERAERAYADEDFAAAEAAYAAVVVADPRHARAVFRLAQLRRDTPREAAALFARYVALVPRDPWGHLALASAYASAGRRADALEAYEEALALEPKDRDIALGGPRLYARLGMTDRAIADYRNWLTEHPDDGEAWRELSEQLQRARRHTGAARAAARALATAPDDARLAARVDALRMRAAPALELGGLTIGETDLTTVGGSGSFDVGIGDATRIGAVLLQRRISGLGELAATRRVLVRSSFTPRADLDVQIGGGLVHTYLPGTDAFDRTRPELTARVRRRPARAGAIVDVRALYGPVDATPQLALEDLTRSQVTAAVDAPIATRLRLRGAGRLAAMTRPDERNIGTRYGGGVAVAVAEGVHVSGQMHHARYREPATGYFAPRLVETIEAGIDLDREWGALGVGLDAGAGTQRVQRHGQAAAGGWGPALRAWALVSWALRPGRSVVIEAETYDSQVADAVVAAEKWRYASVTASFRIALR
jgi:tetratricopeptide (TPR) repeat protein